MYLGTHRSMYSHHSVWVDGSQASYIEGALNLGRFTCKEKKLIRQN